MHPTLDKKIASAQPLSLMHPQTATVLMLITVSAVSSAFWYSPNMALALVFVALCVLVAHKHRSLFILAAYACFPFQSSLTGENVAGNFSVSDALLIIAFLSLPILLLHKRRLVVGPAGIGLLLFLCLAAVSSAFHWEGMTTAVSLARMWVATLLPVLLFANEDSRLSLAHRCFTLFLIGINVLSIGSILAFFQGGINASMYAMGNHKNLLGNVRLWYCHCAHLLVYRAGAEAAARMAGAHRGWREYRLSVVSVAGWMGRNSRRFCAAAPHAATVESLSHQPFGNGSRAVRRLAHAARKSD